MAIYDKPRFTRDIDLLVHSVDGEKVSRALEPAGYFETAKPWIFKNIPIELRRFVKVGKDDHMEVDILVGKDPEIDSIIARSVIRKWEKGTLKVAAKDDLIWLKKKRASDQDKADIKELRNDKT